MLGSRSLGLAYEETGGGDAKRPRGPANVHMVTFSPGETDAWKDGLKVSGVQCEAAAAHNVLARAIRGVLPTKGRTVAAAPLTPHVSLMQNTVGMTRKAHPFNVSGALEQIYSLGSTGGLTTSAASRWLEAAMAKVEGDPLLQALDQAASQVLTDRLSGTPDFQPVKSPSDPARWAGFLPERTPFRWFHESWNILMTPSWAAQLPPRVWVDWSTAILRLAIGFAYLWEAAWYERLATHLLSEEVELLSHTALAESVYEVLPWRPRGESVSVRDVVSPMRSRIARGVAVRRVLTDLTLAQSSGSSSPAQKLKDLSFDEGMQAVREMLQPKAGGALRSDLLTAMTSSRVDNVWEAVRYALATRSDSGSQADFFGLLRNAGPRYAVVEPGTEWTALLAGLAAREPGESSTVAEVLYQLAQLGLHPPLAEVILLLEEAGLARGSADADQAVTVQSPF